MEYTKAIRMNILSLHETQVNLTNTMLRERSQTEKILHDSTV